MGTGNFFGDWLLFVLQKDSAEKPSVHPSRTSGRTEGRLKSLEIFRSTELAEV
jgi:hypothetical protein